MNVIATLLLMLTVSTLTGCTLTPTAESLATYRLNLETTTNQQIKTPALPISLRINKPNASGYMATTRILVVSPDNQVSVYKGAQWNEATPLMVRNHLLDSFRYAQSFTFVSGDEKQLYADYELDSDLRAFQTEYLQGKPLIKLQLVVRLVHPTQKKILASRLFTQEISPASAELSQITEAFSLAQNQLSQSVINWTYQTLSQAIDKAQ